MPAASAAGRLLFDFQSDRFFKPAVFIHIPATADNANELEYYAS